LRLSRIFQGAFNRADDMFQPKQKAKSSLCLLQGEVVVSDFFKFIINCKRAILQKDSPFIYQYFILLENF